MSGFLSKILGGNKSEKDVKKIAPIVTKSNDFFTQYTSISNDALRAKSQDFKQRIKDYLTEIDAEIEQKKQAAEALPETEISQRDFIYKEVDELKKGRDKKIEEILEQIQPEAFALVKETARRFKENENMVATATELDKELATKKLILPLMATNLPLKIPGWLAVDLLPGTWCITMCS